MHSIRRAFAGAVLFSASLFMTMEMWFLGLYLSPVRLIIFTVLGVALAAGLAKAIGFKKSADASWFDAVIDGGVAYLVGFVAAATALWLTSIIGSETEPLHAVSIVMVQAAPAALGAAFARATIGQQADGNQPQQYSGEMFFMVAGAVVFSFNLAPTEEMLLIALRMSPVHIMMLIVVSVLLLHALVYTVGFARAPRAPRGQLYALLSFTLPGYVAVAAVSAYLLWTFGRFDSVATTTIVGATSVLALPGALGAGAARAIL